LRHNDPLCGEKDLVHGAEKLHLGWTWAIQPGANEPGVGSTVNRANWAFEVGISTLCLFCWLL